MNASSRWPGSGHQPQQIRPEPLPTYIEGWHQLQLPTSARLPHTRSSSHGTTPKRWRNTAPSARTRMRCLPTKQTGAALAGELQRDSPRPHHSSDDGVYAAGDYATVRNPCAEYATVQMSSAPYRPQPSLSASGWNLHTTTRVPPDGESTVAEAFIVSSDRPVQFVYVQVGRGQPEVIDVAVAGANPDVPIMVNIPGGLCGQ